MKTSLDHLPHRKQRELHAAVALLLEEFDIAKQGGTQKWRRDGRILRIILYGSYATGDWVDEPQTMKGYRSDFDILVIVNHPRLTDWAKYWYKAEDRFIQVMMREALVTPVNFIVEDWAGVAAELARGHYFFSDIVCDGIELYKLQDGKSLPAPQPVNEANAFEIAQEHFDYWMPSALSFLDTYRYLFGKGELNHAAFELHQAVERLYACVLLVCTNYRPKSHNIKFLRSQCEGRYADLRDAWPRDKQRFRTAFELLKRAYVEARYSKHYTISEEQLIWLGGRIEILRDLTETVCRAQLARLKEAAKPSS